MDDELDFTQPAPALPAAASAPFKAAQSRFYDIQTAQRIFKAMGKEERFAEGQALFTKDEQASNPQRERDDSGEARSAPSAVGPKLRGRRSSSSGRARSPPTS